MGKLKKVGIGFGILILSFFVLVIIVGVTYDSSRNPVSSPNIDSMDIRANTLNGKELQILVSFLDEDPPNAATAVIADADVKIKVVDERQNILYSEEFEISEKDFGQYTSLIQPRIVGYEHIIPLDLVKKSFSSSGTVYLDVKTKEGRFTGDETINFLPMISKEEKGDLLSKQFLKTSTTLNQQITKGNFEVIVKNAGVFTHADGYEWTEDEEYFRIDMSVRNIGNEIDDGYLRDLVILDDKNRQYEKEYRSTLDTYGELYPRVVNDGYLLFEKMPDDVKTVRLVFSMDGETWNDPPYQFEFIIPLDN